MMVVSKTTVDIDISSYTHTHMVVILHTVKVIVIHYVMSGCYVLYCNTVLKKFTFFIIILEKCTHYCH